MSSSVQSINDLLLDGTRVPAWCGFSQPSPALLKFAQYLSLWKVKDFNLRNIKVCWICPSSQIHAFQFPTQHTKAKPRKPQALCSSLAMRLRG